MPADKVALYLGWIETGSATLLITGEGFQILSKSGKSLARIDKVPKQTLDEIKAANTKIKNAGKDRFKKLQATAKKFSKDEQGGSSGKGKGSGKNKGSNKTSDKHNNDYVKNKKLTKSNFPNIKTKISIQKQNRHVLGTKEYKGGGYFYKQADAQKVLDAYHSGKARIIGRDIHGSPIVYFDEVVGVNNNVGANIVNQPTNLFKIKGTKSPSIVPINPMWKPK